MLYQILPANLRQPAINAIERLLQKIANLSTEDIAKIMPTRESATLPEFAHRIPIFLNKIGAALFAELENPGYPKLINKLSNLFSRILEDIGTTEGQELLKPESLELLKIILTTEIKLYIKDPTKFGVKLAYLIMLYNKIPDDLRSKH